MAPSLSLTLMALVIVSGAGCGRSPTVPVEGIVTLDKRPLSGATVMFSPMRASAPGPYTATTDTEGRFALGEAGGERSGAAVGEYLIVIATIKSNPADDAPVPTQKEVVPAEYRNGSKRFTVPSGGTKSANFDIKTR
jgi:hypothetical protein